MEENDHTDKPKKKYHREPPSIPFLWEEKPGIPKKNWKQESPSVRSLPTPPLKVIASVPFKWEEKPGIPLPTSSLSLLQIEPPSATSEIVNSPSSSICRGENKYDSDDGDEDGEQNMFQWEHETFDSETDDSFSSAPSLLANCLVSSASISGAVPAQQTSLTEDKTIHQLEAPSSPLSETGSSTSSYATGASSLVGLSFLECLFPLLPPNSGFLEKIGPPDDHTPPTIQTNKYFDPGSNGSTSTLARRLPTLGELIMMSRRMSYRRKAVQTRTQNLSMVLPKFQSNFHNYN